MYKYTNMTIQSKLRKIDNFHPNINPILIIWIILFSLKPKPELIIFFCISYYLEKKKEEKVIIHDQHGVVRVIDTRIP